MSHTDKYILITRPEPNNQADIKCLSESGYIASGYSLLKFKSCLKIPESALVDYLNHFDGIIALSPRAIQFCTTPCWPSKQYFAIGKATGEHWQQKGIHPHYPLLSTSEGMLELLRSQSDIHDIRLLILRGEISRDWLPDQLRQDGVNVTELCCYRQLLQPISASQFQSWQISKINFIVCTSALQANHLINQARKHAMQHWLSQCDLAVPSQRVADSLIDFRFRHVYNCGGANINALLSTLKSIV
ncbi:MAG: Uroporphyrinogen-III synthase [Candidatus Celerinatantimonas neptuna]|nr:MAG: Uroporphyrinogen-III synthase [Candidatus Celerinatantimonas neptuna]